MSRTRRNRMVFVATMVLVVGALLLIGRNAPLPLTVLAFALAWWRFCRPWWHQRREAQPVQGLPTWQLSSPGGPAPGPQDGSEPA